VSVATIFSRSSTVTVSHLDVAGEDENKDHVLYEYTTVSLTETNDARRRMGLSPFDENSSILVFNEIDKSEVPGNNKNNTNITEEEETKSLDVSVGNNNPNTLGAASPKGSAGRSRGIRGGGMSDVKLGPANLSQTLSARDDKKQGGYFVLTPMEHGRTRLTLTQSLCGLDEVRMHMGLSRKTVRTNKCRILTHPFPPPPGNRRHVICQVRPIDRDTSL